MRDHILSSPQRLAREICSEIMATEDEIAEAIEQAVKYEREACARIAEACGGDFERDTGSRTESATRKGIAAAIRNRT